MNKVQDCLERIRVVRGSNYGVITNEQIEIIFDAQCLNGCERKYVLGRLKENGIVPISEDESYFKWKETKFPQKENDQHHDYSCDIEECEVKKEEMFEKNVDEIVVLLNNEPEILQQYKNETLLFREFLIKEGIDTKCTTVNRISNAIMKISKYRVRRIRTEGWVCGTYMSNVRKNLVRKIRYYFDERELEKFVQAFVSQDDINDRNRMILLFLLHSVPRTVINRYRF